MVSTCELEDKLTVRFEGRMDTAQCAQVEPEVRATVAGSTAPVVFDLDGVDFVCSAFLRLCIHAFQLAPDHKFQISNVHPSIRRVFKIAGMDSMLAGIGN